MICVQWQYQGSMMLRVRRYQTRRTSFVPKDVNLTHWVRGFRIRASFSGEWFGDSHVFFWHALGQREASARAAVLCVCVLSLCREEGLRMLAHQYNTPAINSSDSQGRNLGLRPCPLPPNAPPSPCLSWDSLSSFLSGVPCSILTEGQSPRVRRKTHTFEHVSLGRTGLLQ